MTKKDFTYEELLQKIKEQDLLIQELKSEKSSITNFEYFVNESPDLVCIADSNAYFKIINDSFVKVLGYSREELLSRPFIEFIHKDDLEKTFDEVKLLSKNNSTVDFENRYVKKNGDLIYLSWRANLNASNNLIYAIARDMTEFRTTQEKLISSEKSLNEAQNIAKIGSWDFNLITQDLNWSNELYKIFEIEKKANDANLYEKYLSRFLAADIETLNNNINNTIINKVSFEMEHQIVFENRKRKWVYCTGLPILDKESNVIALKGVVQDVTQKKLIADTIKAKDLSLIHI
jgi:PAS domain S-box-containing protein